MDGAADPADSGVMDLISDIASLSTALSMAQIQNAVGVKVLKIAQGQQQAAADLIEAAVETMLEAVEQFDGLAGTRLDATA